MPEQILKTEVRLFRDNSITHFTSIFVANQIIVRYQIISESQISIIHFFEMAAAAQIASNQYFKAVMVRCISKQSAVAEKVYIGVKWAVNLSKK